MMGTSISFYRGAARTEALRQAMEDAAGVPCTTMSHAVVRSLKALGVRRVAVATSYIEALNRSFARALDLAGALPHARRQATTALRRDALDREKVLGAAFKLLDEGAPRIGSARYLERHPPARTADRPPKPH